MATRPGPAQRSWTGTLPQRTPATTARENFAAKKEAAEVPAAWQTADGLLESQSRAKGDPQIVMRAVLEVNFVAHLGAQSDRSYKAL